MPKAHFYELLEFQMSICTVNEKARRTTYIYYALFRLTTVARHSMQFCLVLFKFHSFYQLSLRQSKCLPFSRDGHHSVSRKTPLFLFCDLFQTSKVLLALFLWWVVQLLCPALLCFNEFLDRFSQPEQGRLRLFEFSYFEFNILVICTCNRILDCNLTPCKLGIHFKTIGRVLLKKDTN